MADPAPSPVRSCLLLAERPPARSRHLLLMAPRLIDCYIAQISIDLLTTSTSTVSVFMHLPPFMRMESLIILYVFGKASQLSLSLNLSICTIKLIFQICQSIFPIQSTSFFLFFFLNTVFFAWFYRVLNRKK